MKEIAMAIILSIMILGCSETVNFEIPQNEEFKLTIRKDWNEDSNNVKTCVIQPNTEQFIKLLKLLDDNKLGWRKEYASILPIVSVSNSKFWVFFSGNRIVTVIDRNQYSHKIKANDYTFLNCD